MARGIIVKLTDEQQALIEPAIQEARNAEIDGKLGMVVAQIYIDHMDVGFIRHEKSVAIQKIMAPGKAAKAIKSAYDKD